MFKEEVEYYHGAEDASVEILDFPRSGELKVEGKEDPEATENSSSFDDTNSGYENTSGLSDVEVESQFFGGSDLAPPFDGFDSIFPIRKKKLTAHWRNFIRPLMWRCKWAELRIKKLDLQALKYARELANNDHEKIALDQTVVEQCGSKFLPYTHRVSRKHPVERRKRKRIEDTTDITSFMSQHILFAERDNKRFDLDGVPAFEKLGSSGHHTTSKVEFSFNSSCILDDDDDNFLNGDNDNFIEQVLQKIELVHTRVHKLKTQLDCIMVKNAAKFSSSENLCQLLDGDMESPMLSGCNGDSLSLDDFIGDIEGFIIPDTLDSFGEAIAIPDIVESTVGLLSSVDVTQHNPQIGDSSEKIVDNILIQNEADEAECSTLRYNHKTEEAEHTGDNESNKPFILAVQPDNPLANQATVKSCLSLEINFPTNKRKRGERKACSGNWGRH